MKRWKTRSLLVALGVGASATALVLPAFGQDSPESLLPEGFNDPVPPAPPASPPPPSPAAPTRPVPGPAAPTRPAGDPNSLEGEGGLDEFDLSEFEFEDIPPEYELPAQARRSLEFVGPLGPRNGGYGRAAFGDADGRYLEALMRSLDAPVASRWMHISLRRALLSNVPTPRGVLAPDWVAERAWLLVRMGEVDGARMLVQRVDSDRYTPKLYAVAMQAGLAAGDVAGFCPLVAGARRSRANSPAWVMSDAICAGLGGESARAVAQMNAARQQGITNGFDIRLAERAVNAGANPVSIDWDNVERLNAWRFGIAAATDEDIPDELYASAGPQVAAWRARAPFFALADRVGPARDAAVIGVFSNQSLVSMYSALLADLDPSAIPGSTTDLLRSAYVAPDEADRIGAMQTIWADEAGIDGRYAGLILTARAAARIDPDDRFADSADELIASMMSAGLDISASRWADVVEDGGNQEAWALLAVGAPEPVVETDLGRVEDYGDDAGSDGRHRAQLLAAALAGLDRIDPNDANEAFGLRLGTRNIWTRQLDRVARQRRVGLVALLSAMGMQSRSWRGVPPYHLYHIVRAFRLAGREPEARMIAAEAVTRA